VWGATGAVQLDHDVADLEQVPMLSGAWGCAVQLPVMYHEMQRMIKGSYAAASHPPPPTKGRCGIEPMRSPRECSLHDRTSVGERRGSRDVPCT